MKDKIFICIYGLEDPDVIKDLTEKYKFEESNGNYCWMKDTDSSPKKYEVTPQKLYDMSFDLGRKIIESEFRPDWIIALWRGGAPVGICVQEILKVNKIIADHISVRTSSYTDDHQQKTVRVHGLEYVVKNAQRDSKVLLVDDIFDTGRSCKAVIDKLQRKMRLNTPTDIRVATLFYKPQNNKTDIIPHFFVEKTNEWVVFPHELT